MGVCETETEFSIVSQAVDREKAKSMAKSQLFFSAFYEHVSVFVLPLLAAAALLLLMSFLAKDLSPCALCWRKSKQLFMQSEQAEKAKLSAGNDH